MLDPIHKNMTCVRTVRCERPPTDNALIITLASHERVGIPSSFWVDVLVLVGGVGRGSHMWETHDIMPCER